MKTAESQTTPKQVRGGALYRLYALRRGTFGGEEIIVIGEQIGGDIWGRKNAEAVRDDALRARTNCQLQHVGGVD